MSVIFYAWLSAASPDRWPSDRAGLWVTVALFFVVLFFLFFIYCLVSLIRDANCRYREKQSQSATQHPGLEERAPPTHTVSRSE